MPLYEYACRECQHSFEELVLNGEQVACPQCHSDHLERRWSVPARPRQQAASLPLGGCDPGLPPCGPGCCRLPGAGNK